MVVGLSPKVRHHAAPVLLPLVAQPAKLVTRRCSSNYPSSHSCVWSPFFYPKTHRVVSVLEEVLQAYMAKPLNLSRRCRQAELRAVKVSVVYLSAMLADTLCLHCRDNSRWNSTMCMCVNGAIHPKSLLLRISTKNQALPLLLSAKRWVEGQFR